MCCVSLPKHLSLTAKCLKIWKAKNVFYFILFHSVAVCASLSLNPALTHTQAPCVRLRNVESNGQVVLWIAMREQPSDMIYMIYTGSRVICYMHAFKTILLFMKRIWKGICWVEAQQKKCEYVKAETENSVASNSAKVNPSARANTHRMEGDPRFSSFRKNVA